MADIRRIIERIEGVVFKDDSLEIRVRVLDPFPSEEEQIEIEEANPKVHYIWVVPDIEQIEYDRLLYLHNLSNRYRH